MNKTPFIFLSIAFILTALFASSSPFYIKKVSAQNSHISKNQLYHKPLQLNVLGEETRRILAVNTTPTPAPKKLDTIKVIDSLVGLMFGIEKLPTPRPPRFLSVTPTQTDTPPSPSTEPENSAPTVLNIEDLAKWGLPPPIAEDNKEYQGNEIVSKMGVPGYESLYKKLKDQTSFGNPAKELLAAEKKLGSSTIPYLTTTWLWFENDFKGGIPPDNYQINCHDNPSLQNVGTFCPNKRVNAQDKNTMLQIAGYQAFDRAADNHFIKAFTKCYGANANPAPIMKRVYERSNNAAYSYRRYLSQTDKDLVQTFSKQIDSATINDIARNKDELNDRRKQFFTLLLGKDPCMVIALNSEEVNEGDLIRCIKNTSCGWAGYVRQRKQHLSNMVAALYKFDQGTIPGEPTIGINPPVSSGGTAVGCDAAGTQITIQGTQRASLNRRDKCMKPTMLIIHWTVGWISAETTLGVLNDRGLSCHFATDQNKQLQALSFYKDKVERSACALGYNDSSISNEISGDSFDSIYNNPNHPRYTNLMKSTAQALQSSCRVMKQYNIPISQVYGHYQLTPGKSDPGSAYLTYFKQRLAPMLNNNCTISNSNTL